MAACSVVEEKPSPPDEPAPTAQTYVENSDSHEMQKNCLNNLISNSENHESSSEVVVAANPGNLKELSDDDFRHLLDEATTYNKPAGNESVLLKQLRKDVPSTSNVVETNCPSRFSSDTKTSGLVIPFHEDPPLFHASQRTRKSKHKTDSKSNSNASHSNPNRSQSLKDLSVDLTKTKKSHKSHRTLSLSSEESFTISSDHSLTSKTGKKSYKQSSSNSSKSELNKSNRGFSKVPQNSNSVITLQVEDINSQGLHSGAQSENLPYNLLENETDISLSSNRLDASSEKNSRNHPIEIEMDEFKSDKETKNDKTVSCNKESKSKNEHQRSSSQFYVPCSNDGESTMAIPLPFPLVPWPKPLQIQSYFSSLQMETDSFNSRNDKQNSTTDINGNPFPKPLRPNVTPILSTAVLDSNSGMGTVTKNRKNKRAKKLGNQEGILAGGIEGNRGDDDIPALIEFINSSDKKNKSIVKGSQNQILTSKNSVLNDHNKKKSLNKDSKSPKNVINSEEKNLPRCSSLNNIATRNEVGNKVTYSYEAEDRRSESSSKKAVGLNKSISKHLDVNSNVENKYTHLVDKAKDSSTFEESGSRNLDLNSECNVNKEVSGFAADFYSTVDLSSKTFEEAGFLTVTKKQRKKQVKRSDGYRWRNSPMQRKRERDIMLPLSESKCGKQDSRRKSTSSVPHSDHSSADNSDSDSVHSLPVQSSVPHPTKPYPHTTPSSSSSTPQASYADIARMPNSKLNSPAPCIMTQSGLSAVRQQSDEQETKKLENSSTFPLVKRRVSDSKESSMPFSKGSSCLAVKESDCHDVKKTQAKSTREINTQTEPLSANSPVNSNAGLSVLKRAEETELCSSCISVKHECSCSKSQVSVRQKTKNTNIPAVIMDNMPLEDNTCNFSFVFDIDEVLQTTPSKSIPPCNKKVGLDKSSCMAKSDITSEITVKHRPISVNRISSVTDDSSSKCSLSTDESKPVSILDLSHQRSSQPKSVSLGSGKIIRYKETEVQIKGYNNSECIKFHTNDFEASIKEIRDNQRKGNSRMVHYSDISR